MEFARSAHRSTPRSARIIASSLLLSVAAVPFAAAPLGAAAQAATPTASIISVTPLAHAQTATSVQSATLKTTAASKKLTAKAVGQSKTYVESRKKLAKLKVKGRAAKTGYARSKFGATWADQDRNGCDTRNDILRRDLGSKKYKTNTRNCVVSTGKLKDKYTATTISFNRSKNASAVQIDHVVALSDAWQKGAQKLTKAERTNFANDPLNLRAAQGKANQQKGASDAASWLPKNKKFRCEYVATQVDVKTKYRLWVTSAEKKAMSKILKGCSGKVPQLAAVPALTKPVSTSGATGKAYAPKSDGSCPSTAPIKGNQNSMKYHTKSSPWYSRTKAEACFKTEGDAVKAGFHKAG